MPASLRLIPVMDLMGGLVVRAKAGRRDEYRPLQSTLCRSCRPEAVLEGLLALYPFETVYLADLDAILGRGDHAELVAGLQRRFPGLEFWVDGGFSDPAAAAAWQARGLGRAVLGSESLARAPGPGELDPGVLLSLDYRGGDFLGPAALEADAGCWPEDVILMTLARVGSNAGPDLATLARFRARAAGTRFLAAGGVRHADDLAALAEAGAAGVLLASALHDGAFSAAQLAELSAPARPAMAARASGRGPDR
ncbi:hypothetical protein EZJ19_13550 [Parasulfuritortus cantonensis]|uniref:Nickel transporter n=1 Tax=Parasulfuritortus cantonensis TaxID=2528202 RepID=A0A4R1B7X0_9PROT|nr:HisA/HisF-related TIM barrel protein [Parasulfuritortus cantonensis]TCJ11889.1 hypothetical protein EZJ19_13550 [Parasulfuritortus cantonensis]